MYALGASYKSLENESRSTCLPGTRKSQLGRIKDWVVDPSPDRAPIMWLSGGAGAGKTSIAQTVAKACAEDQDCLAATFFLKGGHTTRSNVEYVIPTLALELAYSNNDCRQVIEENIDRDPLLLTDRSKSWQFSALIRQPLDRAFAKANHTKPMLIVIDAIDESNSQESLRKWLGAIAESLERKSSPFRLLLTSRPEHTIVSFFAEIPHLHEKIELIQDYESDADIKNYLTHKFDEIRNKHSDLFIGEEHWPASEDIKWIVDKSSGHFIYASTVINFINTDEDDPMQLLDYIRGGVKSPGTRSHPFEELDKLYLAVLHRAKGRSKPLNLPLLKFLAVYSNSHDNLIELHSDYGAMARALNVPRFEVSVLHRNLRSLIGPVGSHFRKERTGFLHKSFSDFLSSPSRSREFFIVPYHDIYFRHIEW